MLGLSSVPRAPAKRLAFYCLSALVNGLGRMPGSLERPLALLMARRIASRMRCLKQPVQPGAVRVLAFSFDRGRQDFAMLASSDDIEVLVAPNDVLMAINALYPIRPPLPPGSPYEYWLEDDPTILAARGRLDRFLREVLAALRLIGRIDCIVSPTAHYEYQMPWAAAADAIGLPFIALHKEFTVLGERNYASRLETLRARGLLFPGTAVLVTNARAKRLFAEAGVVNEDRIVVTGLPRMDRLFDPDSPFRTKIGTRPQVTLFSFGHYAGGLGPNGPSRSKLFSAHDDHGFVRLFDEVHGTIGRLAITHPDVDFVIKPKSLEDWWIAEIDRAIQMATGHRLVNIPNCRAVSDDAAALIRDSDLVIGFGSTVLLEALVLGRPTIVPVFAEAADLLSDYVYLKEDLDIFRVATSSEDLADAVETILDGGSFDPPSAERLDEVFHDYLGFNDAGATDRVIRAVVDIASSAAPRRLRALRSH